MDSYWTTMKLEVAGTHYSFNIGTGAKRSYSSDECSWSPGGYNWRDTYAPYADAINRHVGAADPTILVLLNFYRADLEEVVGLVKNCIAMPYKGEEVEVQHHLYSLEWAPVVNWLYMMAKNNGSVPRRADHLPPDLPDALAMYVDGKPLNTLEMCKSCTFFLDKTMGLCKPLHTSCQKEGFPPLTWDFIQSNGTRTEWLDKHKTDFDAMKELDIPYKKVSTMMIHDSFEIASFDTISVNEDKWEELRKERSDRSVTASRTKRIRKSMCEGCAVKHQRCKEYEICSSNGGVDYNGALCKGPIYGEDHEYALAKRCKPWMMHALGLTLHSRNFDGKKFVPEWRGSRIKQFEILGPIALGSYSSSSKSIKSNIECEGKGVLVAKIGISIMDQQVVGYKQLCDWLGVKPVTKWEHLTKYFKPASLVAMSGLPLAAHFMATAYVLSKGASKNYRPNYARVFRDLCKIEISDGTISLRYSLPRYYGELFNISNLEDVYAMPGGHKSGTSDFSAYRQRENELYRAWAVDVGIHMGTDVWRALFKEHHSDWMGTGYGDNVEVVDEKEMRKLAREKKRELHPPEPKDKKKKAKVGA